MGFNEAMNTREEKTSTIASVYRSHNVDMFTRVWNVSKQAYPISGDAPLRMKKRLEREGVQNYQQAEHLTSVATGRGPWKH